MGKQKPVKVSKVNNTKVINKKLGRLAKRGKLKGEAKAKLFKIREVKAADGLKKRAKIADDWADQRRHKDEQEELMIKLAGTPLNMDVLEQTKRTFAGDTSDVRVKHLLPIKTATGEVVPQSMQVEEPISEEEAQTSDSGSEGSGQEDGEGPIKKKKKKGGVEVNEELTSVPACKRYIAGVCQQIIANPENSMAKLRTLLHVIEGVVLPVATVRHPAALLAMASAAEVFIDIIPGYRIRPQSEMDDDETSTQMKKETRALLEYEEALLRHYKHYLELCEAVVKQTAKQSHVHSDRMQQLAAGCLAQLMVKLAHFNYSANIIKVVVREAALNKQEQVRDRCLAGVRDLFANDATVGQATLEAVRCINRVATTHVTQIKPELLETLLVLKIKEVERRSDRERKLEEKRAQKQQLMQMNKKAKKYHKQLNKLENELRETDAQNSKAARLKVNTITVKQMFHIYFRILKRLPKSRLLRPALDGLSRFAHLINVDFYDDLVATLYDIIQTQNLHSLDCLYAVYTVFQLLSGEGSSINIDPSRFYRAIYKLLPAILLETDKDFQNRQLSVCYRALDIMLVQRRKSLNLERTMAFIKRLCLLCPLFDDVPQVRAALTAIHSYCLTHSRLASAVAIDDAEEGGYGRSFAAALNDPDYANAFAATFDELTIFKTHPDAIVRLLATNITGGCQVHGSQRLRPDIAQTKPWQFIPSDRDARKDVAMIPTPNKFLEFRKQVLHKYHKKISAKQQQKRAEDMFIEGETDFDREASYVCAVVQSDYKSFWDADEVK